MVVKGIDYMQLILRQYNPIDNSYCVLTTIFIKMGSGYTKRSSNIITLAVWCAIDRESNSIITIRIKILFYYDIRHFLIFKSVQIELKPSMWIGEI